MTYYLWILLFGALVITNAQDLSLEDALFDLDEKPTPKPEKPPKAGGDDPKPKPPEVPPQSGGDFSDSDLGDVGNNGYNPDSGKGGRSGGFAGDMPDNQDEQTKDLNQPWLNLLMLLGDNLPDGLLAWIANSKQVVVSVLEKLLELLDLAEAEKQS